MTQSDSSHADPLQRIAEQLKTALAGVVPDPDQLSSTLSGVVNSVLEPFQVVPRREYDNHMDNLHRLSEQVRQLEQRITALEVTD